MSCCFKAQKEKYEFGEGGDDGLAGPTRRQSTKVQKRHSKILLNEVPFTLPPEDDNKQQQIDEELLEEAEENDLKHVDNNGGHTTSVMVTNSAPAGESEKRSGGPEKSTAVNCTNGSSDTEIKSAGVTVITVVDEDRKSGSNSSGSKSNTEKTVQHKQKAADLTQEMDVNRKDLIKNNRGNSGEKVDGDKNNNVTSGEVMLITRDSSNKGVLRTEKESGKRKSATSVSTAEKKRNSARINKDGAKLQVDGQSTKDQQKDIYREPPTDVQKFDDWKEGSKADFEENSDDPVPDYSDPENEEKEEDYVEMRKTVRNRISKILTREEWDKIVAKADKIPEDCEVDIPEPDYEGAPLKVNQRPLGRSHTFHVGGGVEAGGQLKKGLLNPAMDSKARHDLHREMMMNQKLGIDVLHKKSELAKELEKRKEREKSKKHDYERKNSFDIKMQEMANKVKMNEEKEKLNSTEKILEEDDSQPEFLRIHSKIHRHKSDS